MGAPSFVFGAVISTMLSGFGPSVGEQPMRPSGSGHVPLAVEMREQRGARGEQSVDLGVADVDHGLAGEADHRQAATKRALEVGLKAPRERGAALRPGVLREL